MKIEVINDQITIMINKYLIDFDPLDKNLFEQYIKKLIIGLGKKGLKLSGFFKVYVYQNNKYGVIIDLFKEDEIDLFPELIDLKVTYFYDCDLYLKINDYFLISNCPNIYFYDDNYYISINDISESKLYSLIEFSSLTYGDSLYKIENKLVKIS